MREIWQDKKIFEFVLVMIFDLVVGAVAMQSLVYVYTFDTARLKTISPIC